MRRADAFVVLVVVGFGGFIAMQMLGVRKTAPPTVAAPPANAPSGGATSSNEIVVASGGLAAPTRNLAEIRKHLADYQHGTFIAEILAQRDSNIARWVSRRDKPVSVWIDAQSPLAGPELALVSNVRRAFADWGQAGVPLTFTYVGDSSRAEVKVTFVDHFEQLMSGRTLWTRDPNWWILGGDIQLSLRSQSGHLLNNDQLYAIALHEVGHLLGLDHTSNTQAIMAPRVSVLGLSPEDVATMRLIYELPPGSVKAR